MRCRTSGKLAIRAEVLKHEKLIELRAVLLQGGKTEKCVFMTDEAYSPGKI
jgi:hypothetical protein